MRGELPSFEVLTQSLKTVLLVGWEDGILLPANFDERLDPTAFFPDVDILFNMQGLLRRNVTRDEKAHS